MDLFNSIYFIYMKQNSLISSVFLLMSGECIENRPETDQESIPYEYIEEALRISIEGVAAELTDFSELTPEMLQRAFNYPNCNCIIFPSSLDASCRNDTKRSRIY